MGDDELKACLDRMTEDDWTLLFNQGYRTYHLVTPYKSSVHRSEKVSDALAKRIIASPGIVEARKSDKWLAWRHERWMPKPQS